MDAMLCNVAASWVFSRTFHLWLGRNALQCGGFLSFSSGVQSLIGSAAAWNCCFSVWTLLAGTNFFFKKRMGVLLSIEACLTWASLIGIGWSVKTTPVCFGRKESVAFLFDIVGWTNSFDFCWRMGVLLCSGGFACLLLYLASLGGARWEQRIELSLVFFRGPVASNTERKWHRPPMWNMKTTTTLLCCWTLKKPTGLRHAVGFIPNFYVGKSLLSVPRPMILVAGISSGHLSRASLRQVLDVSSSTNDLSSRNLISSPIKS